jgi:hypothetical protein
LLGFGLSQNAFSFFICNYNPKHVVTCLFLSLDL